MSLYSIWTFFSRDVRSAVRTAAAIVLVRAISSLFFGITPTDPVSFIAVPLLLIAVTLFVSYIPARRATRIDPVSALRGDSR